MRKPMKAGIASVAGAALLSSMVTGCGLQQSSTNGSNSSSVGNTATSTSSTGSANIGGKDIDLVVSTLTKRKGNKEVDLVISTLTNPFFVSLQNGAEYEAKKLGYKLVVQNANNDISTELNIAQTDIENKPACLILDPVDSNGIVTAITAANKASIPVFAFDREPAGGKIKTFVGYDAIAAGKRAADALVKAIHGSGKVVEIQGIMGTNVAQDRTKGFEEEISKYPHIQIVSKQPANFDRSTALNVMTNILQAHPDINGVYAENDDMAMGVLAALKADGKAGKVALVGNDGIKDSLDAITSGEMSATNAESPFEEGIKVAEIAGDILNGKAVPPATTLEGRLVTKSNVSQYWDYLKSIGDPND